MFLLKPHGVERLYEMSVSKNFLANRRIQQGLVFLFLVAVGMGFTAWRLGVDLVMLKETWTIVNAFLVKHPATLFWSLVFLSGLPIPTSALLFTAGVVWRQQPIMACSLCVLAMALNLTWTYWLAAGPARRLVERILATTSLKIPDLPRGDHLKLILMLKLTPGIPFFVQNYLLGFLRAPFHLYLPISILCNGVIGTGVVLSGVGLADGKLIPAITGGSLIVVGAVLTQLIRSWLTKRKEASVPEIR